MMNNDYCVQMSADTIVVVEGASTPGGNLGGPFVLLRRV